MPPRASLRPLALALAVLYSASVWSAETAPEPRLTIYRDSGNALFSATSDGTVDSGYAMVNEQRTLDLQSGNQLREIDNLPPLLDPQTLSLRGDPAQWSLRSSQLLPPAGSPNLALQGRQVEVLGDDGQLLAQGQLVANPAGLAVTDAQGNTLLINHYAAIRNRGALAAGASLHLDLDGHRAGAAPLALSYATRGLGWRAVYQAILSAGDRCSMQLDSQASIGNRSGRDWHQAQIELIAGTVNLEGNNSVRPMLMRAMLSSKADSDSLPEQSSLDAYRRYRLPARVDLPDQSITQLPLYPLQTLACQRRTLVDLGGSSPGGNHPELSVLPLEASPTVETRLEFTAPDNLPAGTIYVKSADQDGLLQLLGSSRLGDSAAGQPVELRLGQSFLLTARQQRIDSRLDRSKQQFDEQFRVSVDNAGAAASQLQLVAHPQRWQHWSIVEANARAVKDGNNQVNFQLTVPAHGRAELKYTVRYQWQPGDLPPNANTD